MAGRDLLFGNDDIRVVNTKLAVLVGLNESMILSQIHYWLEIYRKMAEKENRVSEKHYIGGRWWIYNSIEEWHAQFPFWSTKTISRALKELEMQKVIISGVHNTAAFDRIKWYTIDYDALDDLYNESSDVSENVDITQSDKLSDSSKTVCPDGTGQIDSIEEDKVAAAIPENTAEITQEITTTTPGDRFVVVPAPEEDTLRARWKRKVAFQIVWRSIERL